MRHRIPFLDMLRGFAISGILLVNIGEITSLGHDLPPTEGPAEPAMQVLYYLVSARFVPIFMLLFGISMGLIWRSLRERGERGWPQLLRRMLSLTGFGLLHMLLYPGEVLTTYGVGGLLVLPLVLFCSARVLLVIGTVATLAAVALGGGALAIPGLFCLGAAFVGYGVPERLDAGDRWVRRALLVLGVLTAAAVAWQTTEPGDPRFTTAGGVAGMVQAGLYITGLSVLWQTRARRLLSALFTPLGRMAFSNYLGATALSVPLGRLLGLSTSTTVLPALGLAVAVLIVQNLFSRWWLEHFAYGPMEWVWRSVTRWQVVSLRRTEQQVLPAAAAQV